MLSGNCSTDRLRRRWRWLGWGWLLLVVLMMALLAWWLPTAQVNSSVLALLPHDEADTPPAAWQAPMAERIDRQPLRGWSMRRQAPRRRPGGNSSCSSWTG